MENMKDNISIIVPLIRHMVRPFMRPLMHFTLAIMLLVGGIGAAGANALESSTQENMQPNAQSGTESSVSAGSNTPAPSLDDGKLHYDEYPSIRLRALDKITARTVTFDAEVGSIIKFADIYIKILSCRKPPAIEKTESAAFMQIWQVDKASPQSSTPQSHWVFSGWMFASSPALSAMDHPVYDVWVMDCVGKDPEEEAIPTEDNLNNTALPDEGEVKADEANEPSVAPQDAPIESPQDGMPQSDSQKNDSQNPDIPNRYNGDPIPQENIPNTHMSGDAVPQNIPESHNDAKPAFEVDRTPYQPGQEAVPENEPVINDLPQDDSSPPPENAPTPQKPNEKPGDNFNGIY